MESAPFVGRGRHRLSRAPKPSFRARRGQLGAFGPPFGKLDAGPLKTHNTEPPTLRLNEPSEVRCPLTWPGREFDQKGTTPSVEQGHCTLIAVKRYRDPPRIGGRHNFLLPDLLWSP